MAPDEKTPAVFFYRYAVGNNAHAADIKSLLEPFNDGQKGLDVGRITGLHITADGLALIIDNGDNDHLKQIGSMVFAKAPLPDAVSTASFKVDRGGIKKTRSRFDNRFR